MFCEFLLSCKVYMILIYIDEGENNKLSKWEICSLEHAHIQTQTLQCCP